MRRPISVTPAMARFVREGDTFSAGVIVTVPFVDEGLELPVVVTLVASGAV